ncbi:MAG: hypothetical protein Q9195_008504 [Heterodermia aff. obscurata]
MAAGGRGGRRVEGGLGEWGTERLGTGRSELSDEGCGGEAPGAEAGEAPGDMNGQGSGEMSAGKRPVVTMAEAHGWGDMEADAG